MKTNLFFAATLASMAIIGASASVAGATTSMNTTPRNRIARYALREERSDAVAEVLGTTPLQLENTLKTETMRQVLNNAGLIPSEFRQKVKVQLENDLLAKGYTQSQINNVLNQAHASKHKNTDSTGA